MFVRNFRERLREDLRMDLTQPMATLAAAVVAVIAVGANYCATKKTLEKQQDISQATLRTQQDISEATFKNQREMAQDERIWAERSALYVDLAREASQDNDFIMIKIEGLASTRGPIDLLDSKEHRQMEAKTAIYASAEVSRRYQQLYAAIQALYLWLMEHWDDKPSQRLKDPEVIRLRGTISSTGDALLEQLRKELGLDS